MIAVVDYGMGNLHSIAKALEHVGGEPRVTGSEADLRACERIVLPGVGAFGECMANLERTGLIGVLEEEVLERAKPFLGVCVGMQLLASEGLEHGRHRGLGWFPGSVTALERTPAALRVPHTGWNEVEPDASGDSPLGRIRRGEAFYFNHGYHFIPEDPAVVAARCDYGQPVVAAVSWRNILATQFHPEKSQRAGLDLLAAFVEWMPHDGDWLPA